MAGGGNRKPPGVPGVGFSRSGLLLSGPDLNRHDQTGQTPQVGILESFGGVGMIKPAIHDERGSGAVTAEADNFIDAG
ncbi:MAG: hypothetical protein CBC91_06320, partial [Rickettsiales bacterium TMED131]